MRSLLAGVCVPMLLLLACGEEKNPYAGRYQGAVGAKTGASQVVGIPGQTSITVNNEEAAEAVGKVAKVEDIEESTSKSIQLICSKGAQLPQVEAQMAVLCLNGQPTEAFAAALKAPYKGGANPPLKVIKSLDVDRVSEFMLLAVIEVPKTPAELITKRETLLMGTTTAGNASSTQTILSRTPGSGELLNSFDVQFDLTVRVGSISVENRRILKSDATALDPEKSTIAVITGLKPNQPDNEDDILATGLSFYIKDGTQTKIVSVNHQKSANRGRHPTAEQTALGLGAATMTSTYEKLSN